MSDESRLSFDDLVARRQQLQRFCLAHYKSLITFQDGISFKLNQSESRLGGTARHLSSTATCIQSLLDCPQELLPRDCIDTSVLARDFAVSAIRRAHRSWRSDGSARIYCRCRTLPLVVYHLPRYDHRVQEHLERILSQLNAGVPRLAIGEASDDDPDPENWYPPNAFHTYWTLYLLHVIEQRFPAEFAQLRETYANGRFNLDRLRDEMLVWTQNTAGYQAALHASDSSTLDSDQLAWSLATIVRFHRDFLTNLAHQDFIQYGFKCLFEHQTNTGIWRTGAPLFHYLKSGNAYCYIFETFTVLLKGALTARKEGHFLRRILRPYVHQLLALWGYATSTQIPLVPEGQGAWSSGHRANRKEPESWATASVYSFSQCLRRLLGIWTRESAAEDLRVSVTHVSRDHALAELFERGDTWAPSCKTAASQLMALFVNPTRFFGSGNSLEPDSQPIREDQARGAILFGPPGTGKTTLSRCVANAIGWDYVELHASHFVADGLPNVQRTANVIFERLLQLDRIVILFDEIDELVRMREMEPDAFGRFLTTSMLPKLAELWKLRKVVYFVATNHIEFFDPAVIRAQRFDALVHVSPPSFERKLDRLRSLLAERFEQVTPVGLTRRHVESALQGAVENEKSTATAPSVVEDRERQLPDACVLAKLLLMRWDQLQELASTIRRQQAGKKRLELSRNVLEAALRELSDQSLRTRRPFMEYVDSIKYEQHDHSKVSVWEIQGRIPGKCKPKLTKKLDAYWYGSKAGFGDFGALARQCTVKAPGVLSCRP